MHFLLLLLNYKQTIVLLRNLEKVNKQTKKTKDKSFFLDKGSCLIYSV